MTTMSRPIPYGRGVANDPVEDDPLVELARIVSGRSVLDEPHRPNALQEDADQGLSESDLARDLEAELLTDLQATFAAAAEPDDDQPPLHAAEDLKQEADQDPFETSEDPVPLDAGFGGYLGGGEKGDSQPESDLDPGLESYELADETRTRSAPESPTQTAPPRDQAAFSNMALRGNRSGPAYDPSALSPAAPVQSASERVARPDQRSGWAATAETDDELSPEPSLDERSEWNADIDPGLAQPSLDPVYRESLEADAFDGDDGHPAPPPPFAHHRDPRLAADPYGEARYANRRRNGRRFYSLIGIVALVAVGTASILVLRGGGTDGEPPLIAADTGPTRVFPEPQADVDAAGNVVFDRINPGENGGPNENLLAGVEPAVDLGVTPQANDGITRILSPAGAAGVVAGIDPDAPIMVRTVTVLVDGAIVENNAVPVGGAEPAEPVAPGEAAAAGDTPDAEAPVVVAPAESPVAVAPGEAAAVVAATPTVGNVPAAGDPIAPGFYVQVSAQGTERAALAQLAEFRARTPSLLGSRAAVIQRAELPQGVYYRVQFGPAASQVEAEQLRASLLAIGMDAFVTSH